MRKLSVPVSAASARQLCVSGRALHPYPCLRSTQAGLSPPGHVWPGRSGTQWTGLPHCCGEAWAGVHSRVRGTVMVVGPDVKWLWCKPPEENQSFLSGPRDWQDGTLETWSNSKYACLWLSTAWKRSLTIASQRVYSPFGIRSSRTTKNNFGWVRIKSNQLSLTLIEEFKRLLGTLVVLF